MPRKITKHVHPNASASTKISARARENLAVFTKLLTPGSKGWNKIWGYVYRRVGQNVTQTEDLMQELSLQLVKNASTFRGESKPTTYAIGIANNLIGRLSRARTKGKNAETAFIEKKRQRGLVLKAGELKGKDAWLAEGGLIAEKERLGEEGLLAQRERWETIANIVRLTPNEKDILFFHFGIYDGAPKTAKETAAQFRINETAARMQIYRAIKKSEKRPRKCRLSKENIY